MVGSSERLSGIMSNVKAVIEFLSDDFDCYFQKDVKVTINHPYNVIIYKYSKNNSAVYEQQSELKTNGIYFLLYEDKSKVYVGQGCHRSDGSGVSSRMREGDHDQSWSVGIAVISTLNIQPSNTNLLAYSGNLRYLENYFYKELQKGAYKLKQGTPTYSPTENEAEIEDFIKGVKIACRLLGYPLFGDYMPKVGAPPAPIGEFLYYDRPKYKGTVEVRNKKFYLLPGSSICSENKLSTLYADNPTYKEARQARVSQTHKINSNFVVTEELEFTCRSAVTYFITGCGTHDIWKV